MSKQLRRVAQVNPPVPELRGLGDDEVTFLPLEAVWPDGRRRYEFTKPANTAGYTVLRRGDVVMPKITPTFEAGRVFVADDLPTAAGLATTEVHVLRPRGIEPRYLAYFLRTQPVLSEGETVLQGVGNLRRVTAEWVSTLSIPVDNESDQARIADYLDRETATIDALIEKQHDLVSALRDRSLAVRDAVFGPRVGHGERLKWAIQEIDERAGEVRRTLDVLSVSIAWGVSRKSDRGIHQASSEDTSHYKVVRPGDVVINRMRAFQGGLGCSDFEGLTSPDYGVLRVRNLNVDSRWVAAVMKTEIFVGEMVSRLRGIGTVNGSSVRTPRVSLSDICEIRVFVPPLEVQRADVARFEYENAQIDALIAKAERFIELAQERRAALITAAVTGQIEIPTED